MRTVCNVLIITQGKIQTQITYNTSHKFCCSFVFPQSLLGLALYFKYNGKLIAVDTCSSSTRYITNYCFAISHMVVFVLIFLKFLRVWCPLHWNMHWISSLFYSPLFQTFWHILGCIIDFLGRISSQTQLCRHLIISYAQRSIFCD